MNALGLCDVTLNGDCRLQYVQRQKTTPEPTFSTSTCIGGGLHSRHACPLRLRKLTDIGGFEVRISYTHPDNISIILNHCFPLGSFQRLLLLSGRRASFSVGVKSAIYHHIIVVVVVVVIVIFIHQ